MRWLRKGRGKSGDFDNKEFPPASPSSSLSDPNRYGTIPRGRGNVDKPLPPPPAALQDIQSAARPTYNTIPRKPVYRPTSGLESGSTPSSQAQAPIPSSVTASKPLPPLAPPGYTGGLVVDIPADRSTEDHNLLMPRTPLSAGYSDLGTPRLSREFKEEDVLDGERIISGEHPALRSMERVDISLLPPSYSSPPRDHRRNHILPPGSGIAEGRSSTSIQSVQGDIGHAPVSGPPPTIPLPLVPPALNASMFQSTSTTAASGLLSSNESSRPPGPNEINLDESLDPPSSATSPPSPTADPAEASHPPNMVSSSPLDGPAAHIDTGPSVTQPSPSPETPTRSRPATRTSGITEQQASPVTPSPTRSVARPKGPRSPSTPTSRKPSMSATEPAGTTV